MAATKKPSASTKKKSTPKTKTAATKPQKAVVKKATAPTRKTTAKRTAKKKVQSVQSFRLSSESESFISSRITLQTIYWSILSAVILIVGVLILNAQLDILDTLNQISDGL